MAHIYPHVYMDGALRPHSEAQLSIASSAVLYGLSVYTVFPVCVSKVGELFAFRLPEHFKRLQDSARIIGIDGFPKNWTYSDFEAATKKLIGANNVTKDVFVRASLHVDAELPGTRSRGLHTVLSMFVYDAEPIVPQNGARLKTSVWRRVPDFAIPSRAKVNGAYVNSVLAKQDAIDSGYDDCIFLDAQGHVCELSAANIFMVRGNTLVTPDTTSDLLEGINRRSIIELAAKEGLHVHERGIDLTELYVADEVFACGTSAYVAPVTEIDARTIGSGTAGPVTIKLKQLHHDILHGHAGAFGIWLTQV